MLFPTLSVTVIGLLVSLVALLKGAPRSWRSLALGVVGTWMGFIVGGIVGVTVDVILATGIYVAIVGHLAAAAGAFLTLARFGSGPAWPRRETPGDPVLTE